MQDDIVFIWIFLMMTIMLVPFVSLGSRSSLVVVGEVSSLGIIDVPMLIHLTSFLSKIDLSLKININIIMVMIISYISHQSMYTFVIVMQQHDLP